MITGMLGYLDFRKRAYTGKPAEAMFYDEAKGRYVIAGEEDLSDEDDVAPPPMGLRGAAKAEDKVEEKKEEKKEESSGLDSLTAPKAFGGFGRGRGRGRGNTRAPVSRFP